MRMKQLAINNQQTVAYAAATVTVTATVTVAYAAANKQTGTKSIFSGDCPTCN